jgi:hypothetical protein
MEIERGEFYECPYCGVPSRDIEEVEIDWESWVRVVRCKKCHRHWQEYLKVYCVYIPMEYEKLYEERHADKNNECEVSDKG